MKVRGIIPITIPQAVELLHPDECPDELAWAMSQADQAALDKLFEEMFCKSATAPFTFERCITRFLELTDKDLIIEL